MWSAVAVAIAIAAVIEGCSPSSPRVVPVEMWVSGDDGLTQRFEIELRAALAESGRFSLIKTLATRGDANGEQRLVLTIAHGLRRTSAEDAGPYAYSIEFTDAAGKLIGESNDLCLEANLSPCIAHVLRDAEAAADRLR